MFMILLRFSDNKAEAGAHMDAHNAWIKSGFDEGVFLVVGRLQPNAGGGILAHQTSHAALEKRLKEDPFVANDVVSAEILEITPAKTDERLQFLLR